MKKPAKSSLIFTLEYTLPEKMQLCHAPYLIVDRQGRRTMSEDTRVAIDFEYTNSDAHMLVSAFMMKNRLEVILQNDKTLFAVDKKKALNYQQRKMVTNGIAAMKYVIDSVKEFVYSECKSYYDQEIDPDKTSWDTPWGKLSYNLMKAEDPAIKSIEPGTPDIVMENGDTMDIHTTGYLEVQDTPELDHNTPAPQKEG